jgi:hypothetical protein
MSSNHDATDADTAVAIDLEPAGKAIAIPPGDVAKVVARSRQRQRRTTMATSIVAAVALLSTITAARLATSSGDDRGTTPLSANGGAVVPGDVPMRWTKVDPKSGLGYARGATDADPTMATQAGAAQRPVYAISTAPGQADMGKTEQSRVIWRSEDGIDWTAASTLTNDLYLADLAAAGDRIYAVGTTAAQSAPNKVPNLVIGWSDDEAKSWSRAPVDVDLAAIATKASNVAVTGSDIASGKYGTVAAVVLTAELDAVPLLPPGTAAPYGWAVTATGIDVLARPTATQSTDPCPSGMNAAKLSYGGDKHPRAVYDVQCFDSKGALAKTFTAQEAYGVTASFTWQQLHVDGDVLKAVRRQPIAFFAPPGSTEFHRVDLPATDPAYALILQATDDGFDLTTSTISQGSMGQPRIIQSADGKQWPVEWQPIGHGLEWITAMGRIDGQVAIIGGGKQGAVLARRTGDGAGSWATTPLTAVIDPAVAQGGTAHVVNAAIGPLGAVAVVAVVDAAGIERGDAPQRVLVSRDGTTWSDTDLAKLTGTNVTAGIIRVAVVGDKAFITANLTPGGAKPKSTPVVLVGVPA